ncbi:kinase-like domain-containing protein [Ochromonadaceae sp. CCMP2298]|nr:kinase-like domain-containing protein [Ochromonadaceae sp. CCMP2298]
METAAAVDPTMASKSKDPLASCNIPEVIEDRKGEGDGMLIYRRGKLLGKGGFAKVFATTLSTGRTQYAIKIVAKASLLKVRAQQKLQTEIKIHKALKHTNVVRFERCFDDSNYYYIVMELCDYNSMSELLRRRKKLSEAEARYYLAQIVESLQYLHSNLVIHRDLKLGNLFIDANMRIKVGDFGLATRLTHADERRKTICGTPNYIAPEILEGKTGHSFEVDIWSTGVILYTMLIGKPPFESKDVKSTYKRILANSYAFPDHTPVASDAKNLIRKMLQARPEHRPLLRHIAAHPFFTRPTAYLPTSLPESALHECPRSVQMTDFAHSNETFGVKAAPPKIDENDPNAINRLKTGPTTRSLKGSNTATALAIVDPQPTAAAKAAAAAQAAQVLGQRPSSRTSAGVTSSARQAHAGVLAPSSRPSSRGGYAQKFDIYVDSKGQTQGQTQVQAGQVQAGQVQAGQVQAGQVQAGQVQAGQVQAGQVQGQGPAEERRASSAVTRRLSSATTSRPLEFEIDKMQTGLESIRLFGARATAAPARERPRTVGAGSAGTGAVGSTAGVPASSSGKTDTWAWSEQAFPASQAVEAPAVHVTTPAPHTHLAVHVDEPAPLSEAVTPTLVKDVKPLGTLETMHEMLNNSFSIVDQAGPVKTRYSSDTEGLPSDKPRDLVAKVWVVRYVDYTSKYGLGFLFNTGSAGVYFNDSTKIVLSADGTVFQYTERRRRDSSTGSEHSSQKHLITSYPPELQKKVTLLKHFRNYLVDQQRSSAQGSESEDLQAAMLSGKAGVLKDGVADGPCAAVKFGQSSTRYSGVDENNGPESPLEMEEEQEMPFLKKWVRTKHAILFRISNRTVQVVFYDRSEVLLSSEARVITYVSKQGQRSEHSLDDVLHTGRLDIAKRLKYTKDIMYRLIHTQSK